MGMAVKRTKKKIPDNAPKKRPSEKRMDIQTSVDGKAIRGIVRMSGRDLRGHLKLTRAIQAISGIGQAVGKVVSRAAIKELKLTEKTLIGELTEEQIDALEKVIANPSKYGVPDFMLNRQRTYQNNSPHHLIATDLQYAVKQDLEHEQDSQSWKGYRHSYGQKVRGQRTRSTGRKGMTVGVLRKSAKQAGAAPATAKEEKKK